MSDGSGLRGEWGRGGATPAAASDADGQSDTTTTAAARGGSQDDAAYFSSRSSTHQDSLLDQMAAGQPGHRPPAVAHDKPLKKTRLAPPLPAAGGGVKSKQKKKRKKLNSMAAATTTKTTSQPAAAASKPRSARQALVLVLFLIGLIVCVSSLLCLLLLPSFVSNQIARKLVLRNNSLLLERWSKPNVPMLFKVWLFNVKNAQQLIERRATKPQLEEIGPFVFNLRRQKDVISFAGDNLYYTERRVYHFNRELSCCAINTTVTIPNIPLMAVVDRALSYNLPIVGRFVPRLINRAIQSLREQLFVRKQAREILFEGYDVELLRMVSRVGSLVGLPQQSQRFALLKGRNDTWRPEQDGVWAINTGARDRKQFGRVSSWNSYKRLPFWPAPQCNVINGSDGTLFPPPIRRSEPLYIFNQELCRTVNLVYDGPSQVRSIQAYRFVLNPANFAHTVSAAAQPAGAAAGSGAPVRVNPTFQNPRLTPPVAPTGSNQAAEAPATSSAALPAAGASPARPSEAPAASASGRNDLKPSASEVAPAQVGAAQPPQAKAASLMQQDGAAAAAAAAAQAQAQAQAQLSQQEKLIRVAQELASERRPESRANTHACFCDRKTTNLNGLNVCELDGLIDLSKCSKQAQVIFGSMPHFHNSDARLQRQVAGLQPNASRHTTYLNIEPNTGLVLGGKRRVQLNVLIKHNNEIDGFENIQDMLVPIVWFEESAEIPEESAQKFRALYIERVRLVNWTLISLFLASLLLLLVDARLLLASNHWRQHFKLTSARTPVSSNTGATSQTNGGGAGKLAALAGSGPSGGAGFARRGANLPLLRHNVSSASSAASSCLLSSALSSSSTLGARAESHSAPSSAASSGGESTAPNSPELRKWTAAPVQQLPGNLHSSPGTTRIHLSGRAARARPEVGGGGGGAAARDIGRP